MLRSSMRLLLAASIFMLSACKTVSYKDVHVEDSNIKAFEVEAEKRLNDLWTLNGSYLPVEGKQNNAFQLNTTSNTNSSGDTTYAQEAFSVGDTRITSPENRVGTTSMDVAYDLTLVDLAFDRRFRFDLPFHLSQSIGLRYTELDFSFTARSEGSYSMHRKESDRHVYGKYGLKLEYPLSKNFGVELKGNASIAKSRGSRDYSAALTYQLADFLVLSARFMTIVYEDNSNSSQIEITSNIRTLGIKLKF